MVKLFFSESFFKKIGITTVASIFILVLLGGIVRISGSGMGCPDWPRCFGHLIPPTSIDQVKLIPGDSYKKGQMIIQNDTLWVAKNKLESVKEFNYEDWEPYTKHSYAKFNALHTWIEFINRLAGALTGLFILLTLVSSFQYRKSKPYVLFLSLAGFLLTMFQAWMGAKVVESNLDGWKITIHLLLAFAIIALVMLAVFHDKKALDLNKIDNKKLFVNVSIIALIISILQIIIGSQVREHVDQMEKTLGQIDWQNGFGEWLESHKLLSMLVVTINIYLFSRTRGLDNQHPVNKTLFWIIVLVVLQTLTGIINLMFDLPGLSQVSHITLSGLMFGAQFYLIILVSKRETKK